MTAPRKVIELLAATSPKELETNVPFAIDSRCVMASLHIEGQDRMKHSDASDLSLYENTWLAAAISMGSGRRSRGKRCCSVAYAPQRRSFESNCNSNRSLLLNAGC